MYGELINRKYELVLVDLFDVWDKKNVHELFQRDNTKPFNSVLHSSISMMDSFNLDPFQSSFYLHIVTKSLQIKIQKHYLSNIWIPT